MDVAATCTAVMTQQVVDLEADSSRQRRSTFTLPLASPDEIHYSSSGIRESESSGHASGGVGVGFSNNSSNHNSTSNGQGTGAAATTTTSSSSTATVTKETRRPIDDAPRSRGLPLTHGGGGGNQHKVIVHEVKLIHPLLNKIPLQFRFGFNGVLSNLLFMLVYNYAVEYFDKIYTPSTIYSVVYLFFIPLSHLMVSLLVFGWPERYLKSLMSNFPIGLTAIAMGSALTAYLDQIDFNNRIGEFIRDNYTFSHMPSRPHTDDHNKEFYSSIVVLTATSIWTYALSVYINSPVTRSDKKEL